MECKHCGANVSEEARFCSECGAKVEREQPREGDLVNVRGTVIRATTVNMGATPNGAELLECPICGAYNEVKDTFRCKGCGRAQICRDHRDSATYLCEECEKAHRATETLAERERKAAVEKTRLEAEACAKREAEEKARPVRQQGDRLWVKLAEGVEMEFVRVPAGEFQMGSTDGDDENPVHTVYLDEYWMGRHPVTNAQYAVFVKAFGWRAPEHWEGGNIPAGKENYPVVNVNYEDAATFCEWLGLQAQQPIVLPGEAQWEKAARGTDGRVYPWGNRAPNSLLCNYGQMVGDATPVGKYSPQGDSPYGCADMAGNVCEWCADWYDGNYYRRSPQANPAGPVSGQSRVLRGGSWGVFDSSLRSSARDRSWPDLKYFSVVGFRCARSLP